MRCGPSGPPPQPPPPPPPPYPSAELERSGGRRSESQSERPPYCCGVPDSALPPEADGVGSGCAGEPPLKLCCMPPPLIDRAAPGGGCCEVGIPARGELAGAAAAAPAGAKLPPAARKSAKLPPPPPAAAGGAVERDATPGAAATGPPLPAQAPLPMGMPPDPPVIPQLPQPPQPPPPPCRGCRGPPKLPLGGMGVGIRCIGGGPR